MAEEFDPLIVPEQGSNRNKGLILMLVAVIFVCCCCFGCAALYYGTEPLMEFLGIPIPWY